MEWISVKDYLPDLGLQVMGLLHFDKYNFNDLQHAENEIRIVKYCVTDFLDDGTNEEGWVKLIKDDDNPFWGRINNITHWLKLPDLPKEKKK